MHFSLGKSGFNIMAKIAAVPPPNECPTSNKSYEVPVRVYFKKKKSAAPKKHPLKYRHDARLTLAISNSSLSFPSSISFFLMYSAAATIP